MNTTPIFKGPRFTPLFISQFLGAFNDNVFKQSLTLWVIFGALSLKGDEMQSGIYTNLGAGIFILPFFLFSATAGQLADKFDKSFILKWVKFAEIFIMGLAVFGFYTKNLILLFVALFLMGSHSAFFGPAKYSILPQLLHERELMAGNGYLEMSTFIAILLGVITGGLLIDLNLAFLSGSLLMVACFGWVSSTHIPRTKATMPDLKIGFNLYRETRKLLHLASGSRTVFLSILGISWLWFLGATLLAQLPNFTKFALHGTPQLATFLVTTFVIGVAAGSILCIKLSRGEIELGLIPFGAFGMTFFVADLFYIHYAPSMSLGTWDFLYAETHLSHWRVIADLILIGVMSSLYVVPLYALVQVRSFEEHRSRIIAANNVLNALFMVGSALLSILFYKVGLTTIQIFLVVAVLNLAVAIYIFAILPEFLMRFVVWILASTIYRLRYIGRENVPRRGAGLIVCNHVSFIDWFIVMAACQRPVRFIMDHRFYKMPLLNPIFRLVKAIPIAPAKEDPGLKEAAFSRISEALKEEHLVCIFPEGMITNDGELKPFRPGVGRILKVDPVPMIPMALKGLWGSFFSRCGGKGAMRKIPTLSRRKITVHIDTPLPASTKAEELETKVLTLLGGRKYAL